jgi:CheY-like chemotaxis protein
VKVIITNDNDITSRNAPEKPTGLNEETVEMLLELSWMDTLNTTEISRFTLEAIVRLTRSKIGYLHLYNEDENIFKLWSWSEKTIESCSAKSASHCSLDRAGVWADCIRRRRPIIHNDYQSLQEKRGLPEGHYPIIRHLSVPVFEGNKIVAVAGVGNKDGLYEQSDIRQIYLLLNTLCGILKQQYADKELRSSEKTTDETDHAGSDSLTNMIRNLRSPMNAVIGTNYLLGKTPLSCEQREYLDAIDQVSRNLLERIDAVSDFSKIEAGRIELETTEFRLHDIMSNMADIIRFQIKRKEIELIVEVSPDIPIWLVGDPRHFSRVLINITRDAVMFTEKGEIIVQADSIEMDRRQVLIQFTVRVPVEEIDRRINVENKSGVGNTFSFTVPFGRSARQTARIRDLKVLVVEDCIRLQRSMEQMLRQLARDVVVVGTVLEALSVLRDASNSDIPFDLVLLDCALENINEIDEAYRIKGDSRLNPPPRVFIVTDQDLEEWTADEALGAHEVIIKLISRSTLVDLLTGTLHYRGRHSLSSFISCAETLREQLNCIRGARILLVDDNNTNMQFAMGLLESEGFVVDKARDGAMAFKILTESKTVYDAVLMDLHMHGLDGFETTMWIRAYRQFSSLPIIIIMSDIDGDKRLRGTKIGVNEFVTRPIDPHALYQAMVNWIVPNLKARQPLSHAADTSQPPVSHLSDLAGIDVVSGLHGLRNRGKEG